MATSSSSASGQYQQLVKAARSRRLLIINPDLSDEERRASRQPAPQPDSYVTLPYNAGPVYRPPTSTDNIYRKNDASVSSGSSSVSSPARESSPPATPAIPIRNPPNNSEIIENGDPSSPPFRSIRRNPGGIALKDSSSVPNGAWHGVDYPDPSMSPASPGKRANLSPVETRHARTATIYVSMLGGEKGTRIDIPGHFEGVKIRELILSKLGIPSNDRPFFSIYETLETQDTVGTSLSPKQLEQLCFNSARKELKLVVFQDETPKTLPPPPRYAPPPPPNEAPSSGLYPPPPSKKLDANLHSEQRGPLFDQDRDIRIVGDVNGVQETDRDPSSQPTYMYSTDASGTRVLRTQSSQPLRPVKPRSPTSRPRGITSSDVQKDIQNRQNARRPNSPHFRAAPTSVPQISTSLPPSKPYPSSASIPSSHATQPRPGRPQFPSDPSLPSSSKDRIVPTSNPLWDQREERTILRDRISHGKNPRAPQTSRIDMAAVEKSRNANLSPPQRSGDRPVTAPDSPANIKPNYMLDRPRTSQGATPTNSHPPVLTPRLNTGLPPGAAPPYGGNRIGTNWLVKTILDSPSPTPGSTPSLSRNKFKSENALNHRFMTNGREPPLPQLAPQTPGTILSRPLLYPAPSDTPTSSRLPNTSASPPPRDRDSRRFKSGRIQSHLVMSSNATHLPNIAMSQATHQASPRPHTKSKNETATNVTSPTRSHPGEPSRFGSVEGRLPIGKKEVDTEGPKKQWIQIPRGTTSPVSQNGTDGQFSRVSEESDEHTLRAEEYNWIIPPEPSDPPPLPPDSESESATPRRTDTVPDFDTNDDNFSDFYSDSDEEGQPPLFVTSKQPSTQDLRSHQKPLSVDTKTLEPPPRVLVIENSPGPGGSDNDPVSPRLGTLTPHNRPRSTGSFSENAQGPWEQMRPGVEDVYDHLDRFFPGLDLDKPVIDAQSGGTSPVTHDANDQPINTSDRSARLKQKKKSIRVVAVEKRNLLKRQSQLQTPTTDKLRRRNTVLWDSKVEEVQAEDSIAATPVPSSPAPPLPAAPPKQVVKWVRGDIIGRGSYGKVYLAMNVNTAEMIAVKQVEKPRSESDKADLKQQLVVKALKSESNTLKDLDHVNIVQYLGIEETSEYISIFMEYVSGGSIAACLRQQGRFGENVVKYFSRQILSGLGYLHARGILHRDLKADNILVDPQGNCKISDFGISKHTDADAYVPNPNTHLQGTIYWMAPEVVRNQSGEGYSAKVDIWGLGCVWQEMCTGERPWKGENMFHVLMQLGTHKLAPPLPEGFILSGLAESFRNDCFVINPRERPNATVLAEHPYLVLPEKWAFTSLTD